MHNLNFVAIARYPLIKRGRDCENHSALMAPTCHGVSGDHSTDARKSPAKVGVVNQGLGCRRKKILGIGCPNTDDSPFFGLIAAGAPCASCKSLPLSIDMLHMLSSSYFL
jgi:hypothetical protein